MERPRDFASTGPAIYPLTTWGITMVVAAPDGVLILDTTEVRWFAPGRLPAEISSWFTADGTVGILEERHDSYRVGEAADTGVKQRFRNLLELKRRLAVGPSVTFAPGLIVATETWRRWSPAYDRVTVGSSDEWVDVHKTVFKRRFAGDGRELPWVSHPPDDIESGCDVEVSEVSLGTTTEWSFSLAAFGPPGRRKDALLHGWDVLEVPESSPEGFVAALQRPLGYPQWLIETLEPSERELLV